MLSFCGKRTEGASAGAVCGWQINRAAVELSVPLVKQQRAGGCRSQEWHCQELTELKSQSKSELDFESSRNRSRSRSPSRSQSRSQSRPFGVLRLAGKVLRPVSRSRPSLLCVFAPLAVIHVQRHKKGANFMSASFNK